MSSETDELRDIFLEVSDEPAVIESQEEGPSREPIGAPEAEMQEQVSGLAREDGLEDAIDDGLGSGSGSAVG